MSEPYDDDEDLGDEDEDVATNEADDDEFDSATIDEQVLAYGEPQPEDEEGESDEGEPETEDQLQPDEAAAVDGAGGRARGVGPVQRLRRAAASLDPRRLLRRANKQKLTLQRLLFQVEHGAVFAAKLALRAALRAARPALVVLVLSRVSRTLEYSRDPVIKMLQQPPEKQMDYYYSRLLGPDWEQQLEGDLMDAFKEVDEGLVTEEINAEKRKIAAVMLRRLEVDEWDKQRMRHYYYGQFGLGPWYWDMEERLHNPYFLGGRAWNGPIESWVGENKTFNNDIPPENRDTRELGAQLIKKVVGDKVDRSVLEAIKQKEQLTRLDRALASPVIRGIVDPLEVRAKLQGRT